MFVILLMDCLCCWFVLVFLVDVYIWSEGCNDLLKIFNICGIVYIRVNGKDYFCCRRGYNVVVLDEVIGKINCVIDFIVFLIRIKIGGILNYEVFFVLWIVFFLFRFKFSLL